MHKILKPEKHKVYFLSLHVNHSANFFTRTEYTQLLLETLKLYQEESGLKIFEWLIMSNYVYLIASSENEALNDWLKDFTMFTSIVFIDALQHNKKDDRKEWLLNLLLVDNKPSFWKENFFAYEISTQRFYATKQKFLHLQPVKSGLVTHESEYLLSSCASRLTNTPGILKLSEFIKENDLDTDIHPV